MLVMEHCFNIDWRIHHKTETVSTNLDARGGRHGDVFTADCQTAGRGRLDHRWLSPPGVNLMMSAVLSVEELPPEQVATLPLVAGLAVSRGLSLFLPQGLSPLIKWPNDVLVDGRKIAGILCERHDDLVIIGIGVNVDQEEFAREIAEKATSIALIAKKFEAGHHGRAGSSVGETRSVTSVRGEILRELDECYCLWRAKGFGAIHPLIADIDFLCGRNVSVRQADGDPFPILGRSHGVMPDGSLDVGGTRIYAGEAHVEKILV